MCTRAIYADVFEVLITGLGLLGAFALGGACSFLGSGPGRFKSQHGRSAVACLGLSAWEGKQEALQPGLSSAI